MNPPPACPRCIDGLPMHGSTVGDARSTSQCSHPRARSCTRGIQELETHAHVLCVAVPVNPLISLHFVETACSKHDRGQQWRGVLRAYGQHCPYLSETSCDSSRGRCCHRKAWRQHYRNPSRIRCKNSDIWPKRGVPGHDGENYAYQWRNAQGVCADLFAGLRRAMFTAPRF